MLNARDHCGCTPLHNAIIRNHRGVMLYLINQGADINVQDNIGRFHRFYTILIHFYINLTRVLIHFELGIFRSTRSSRENVE